MMRKKLIILEILMHVHVASTDYSNLRTGLQTMIEIYMSPNVITKG